MRNHTRAGEAVRALLFINRIKHRAPWRKLVGAFARLAHLGLKLFYRLFNNLVLQRLDLFDGERPLI